MNSKPIDKTFLENQYLIQKKNPYEIGELLQLNHKTVRAYLRKYKIPLRTSAEYNYINKATHVNPTDMKLLMAPLSIAAHTAYLCEGWHTVKSNQLYFCNQDPALIDLIIKCLEEVYQTKRIRMEVCAKDKNEAIHFLSLYNNTRFQLDLSRKNPIIRVHSGGKNLVRDFVKNAYTILNSL